jgi:hypothetical protein
MPIGYYVTENKLTSPVSYYCRVAANEILDFQDIAELLNAKNPTVPTVVALSILNDLRTVVKEQLLAGKTVKLTNFCSFVTTLPVKLESPIDPLPSGKLNVTGKISQTMRDEMRNEAEFTREGYTSKEPSIIQEVDIQRQIAGTFEATFPFQIFGSNLKFNQEDPEQGLFLNDGTNNEFRVDIYSEIGNTKVSSIVTREADNATGYFNEFSLQARTKYTETGSLRITSYSKPIRQRVLTSAIIRGLLYSLMDGNNTWFGSLNSSNVSTASAHANLILRRDTLGVITARMQNYQKYGGTVLTGDPVTISGNGLVAIPPIGEVTSFEITISDFSLMNDLMDKYSGELIEPLTIVDVAAP